MKEMLWGEPPTTVRLYEHKKSTERRNGSVDGGSIAYGEPSFMQDNNSSVKRSQSNCKMMQPVNLPKRKVGFFQKFSMDQTPIRPLDLKGKGTIDMKVNLDDNELNDSILLKLSSTQDQTRRSIFLSTQRGNNNQTQIKIEDSFSEYSLPL